MPCMTKPTWSNGTSGWSRESGRAWMTRQVPQKGPVAILLPKKRFIIYWIHLSILGERHLSICWYMCAFLSGLKTVKINKVISNILLWILDATGTDVQIKQVFNATQKGFKRQAWCQRVPAEVVPSNYLHFVWNSGHFWNCKHLRGSTHTAAKTPWDLLVVGALYIKAT